MFSNKHCFYLVVTINTSLKLALCLTQHVLLLVMLLWHVQLIIKIVICSRITFFSIIWQAFWMQSRCYYKKKNPLTKHWIIYIQQIHWERTCVVIKTQIWIKAFKQFQPSHCNSNDFNTFLTKIYFGCQPNHSKSHWSYLECTLTEPFL